MKSRVIALIVVVALLGALGAYTLIMSRSVRVPIDPAALVAPLPNSPRDVTVRIEGTEVSLKAKPPEETGTVASSTTTIVGESIPGDINEDGTLDAVLILQHDTGGSGTFYYVAGALFDELGYMGTDAVFLGDRIALMDTRVSNGIITVRYRAHGEGQAFTDFPNTPVVARFVYVDSAFERVDEGEADFVEGLLSYRDDVLLLSPCAGLEGIISNESRSLGALQAVYAVRGRNDEPVFVTVLAHEKEDDILSYEVVRLLTVPERGACTRLEEGSITDDAPNTTATPTATSSAQ